MDVARLIDAFTGRDVRPGEPIPDPGGGWWMLLAVDDRLLAATATIMTHDQRVAEVPLAVRFLLPGFPFQRVLLFPS